MKTFEVITVDFDFTLAEPDENGILKPVERVVDFVKEKHKEGTKIHIVTFRHEKDRKEVEDFCEDLQIPYESIVCTASESKTPFLKELKSELHIDDDIQTLMMAHLAGIETLLVDWGQNNCTSRLFDKI